MTRSFNILAATFTPRMQFSMPVVVNSANSGLLELAAKGAQPEFDFSEKPIEMLFSSVKGTSSIPYFNRQRIYSTDDYN